MKKISIVFGILFLVVVGYIFIGKIQTVPTVDFGSKDADYETALFAGGCFWCTEADFEKVNGVISVVSGYTGGFVENPTYGEVSSGKTGHVETVRVEFDSDVVTYLELLEVFFMKVDPTDNLGQFVDRGLQYRPVIFYLDENQKMLAEQAKMAYGDSGIFDGEILVDVLSAEKFYLAEEYHQDYYKKNPIRYNYYRSGSGRDQFLDSVWKDRTFDLGGYLSDGEGDSLYVKLSDEDLKQMLTQLQYDVTQRDATETPFDNKYWDNKEEGIYVDIVSGEPLFSSKDKYESGTGWPSFTKPIVSDNIVLKKDFKLILPRTEVRSKYADSHLGHLFNDGPDPGGLRYCMNSAALKFISKDELVDEGYEEYVGHFA